MSTDPRQKLIDGIKYLGEQKTIKEKYFYDRIEKINDVTRIQEMKQQLYIELNTLEAERVQLADALIKMELDNNNNNTSNSDNKYQEKYCKCQKCCKLMTRATFCGVRMIPPVHRRPYEAGVCASCQGWTLLLENRL
jgi:hypothetical protein